MIRYEFTNFNRVHAIARITNRLDRAVDPADLEQAAQFSDWFDSEMIRADRQAFWEGTCAA